MKAIVPKSKRIAELERRAIAIGKSFTAEAAAGGHGPQLQYLLCAAQYVIVLCSRRAGKTWANCILLALTALATPNVTCVYLGLTEKQTRSSAWVKCWKPILKRFNIPHTSTEDMVTTFSNGSIVHFGSLSTERVAASWLGNSLAGGICIIDECQEASTDLLEATERIVEPALSDTTVEHPNPGRLIWSGTWPDTATGRLYKLYKEENSSYAKFTWNRFQNPFLINQEKVLATKLARLKVTVDEPFIQREDFGNPVYDKNATAYGFDPAKNIYLHTSPLWAAALELKPFKIMAAVPPGCTSFVIGLDPAGTSDRYAIEAWGWGPESDKIYQVFEAVTDKGANPLQSQANEVVRAICKLYPGVIGIVRDHGSAAVTDDTLLREYGIANIEPAVKAALKSRVDRFRDLLGTGRAQVMKGSALAEDLALCRWDLKARELGQWKWHSSHHGDAADAANYAIGKYVSLSGEPKAKAESRPEEMERLAREAWRQPSKVEYGPPANDTDQAPGWGSSGYGGPQGG